MFVAFHAGEPGVRPGSGEARGVTVEQAKEVSAA